MKIVVIGASGYIGSHLVPELVARGHHVRALARRREVLEGRGWDGVELVSADALRPETLPEALAGQDVAYYLIHSMGSGDNFAELDREAAANVARAAAEAGVARVVYLGGLQSGDSSHLRSRRETGDVLRAGTVPVTELRAGVVVGAGSAAFEVIRDLVNHLPVMVTPKWVRSRSQPIALRDLLAYLAGVLSVPETSGQTLDVAGPDVLSYREMMMTFAAVAGKRRRIVPVPVLTPRISSYWLDLVTSVPASVARPLIDGLKHDLLADDLRARQLLPMPLMSYREAVVAALKLEREDVVAARWTEGSLAFRGYNAEVSFYSKGERSEVAVRAPAQDTWLAVSAIGGNTGYYYADWLWRLRGLMDRMVGGVGMRRGRRHPVELRVGDTIDFWRVAAIDPGKRLTLVAEMKLPGAAVLEFDVAAEGASASRLGMTARFHPTGLPGLLYWYSVLPFHTLIFRETPRAIGRAAERAARQQPPAFDLRGGAHPLPSAESPGP